MERIRKHHRMMVSLSAKLLRSVRRPVFLFLTSLSFTIITISSLAVYYFEGGVNPGIQSWMDALYYSVTVTTGVGLGDISPVSIGGRILSMLMMLMGTAIFVAFTASLATMLMEPDEEEF